MAPRNSLPTSSRVITQVTTAIPGPAQRRRLSFWHTMRSANLSHATTHCAQRNFINWRQRPFPQRPSALNTSLSYTAASRHAFSPSWQKTERRSRLGNLSTAQGIRFSCRTERSHLSEGRIHFQLQLRLKHKAFSIYAITIRRPHKTRVSTCPAQLRRSGSAHSQG